MTDGITTFDPPTHRVVNGVCVALTPEEIAATLAEWEANAEAYQAEISTQLQQVVTLLQERVNQLEGIE